MIKDTGSGKARREKLGVKPGQTVAVVGNVDSGSDVKDLGASIVRALTADWIFLAVDNLKDLKKIHDVRRKMSDEASIWAVWPKGSNDIKEDHIRQTALTTDLVDVKVMSWSDTHSGLKLVVRKERRR